MEAVRAGGDRMAVDRRRGGALARFALGLRSADSPRWGRTALSQTALCLGLVVVLVAWLAAVGRPLICPCGTVSLFVPDVASPETSQQIGDWYSLLHLVFGFALFLFLDWLKPEWRTGQKLVIAIASSVVWEAMENLPSVIALFANAPGAPPYTGDSVLNAVADTLFVGVGFLVARSMPVGVVLALGALLEIAVLAMAGDGYVLGSLRLAGFAV